MLLHFLHDALGALWRQHAVWKANRENLIRTDGWVWGSAICNVIEASSLFIPEQAIEAPTGHSRHVAVTLRASFISKLLGEVLHDAERVVPKRLDLNGLS